MVQINPAVGSLWNPIEQSVNLPASTYNFPGIAVPEATQAIALVAAQGVVTPFFLNRAILPTDLGVVVTVAGTAASKIRIALYDWDHVNRALGSLLKDYGVVAADATGLQALTAQTYGFKNGWYAWVIVSDAAPTVRCAIALTPETAGAFTISTTTILGVTHYTCSLTNPIASGYPAVGPAVTPVTSATEFRQNFFVMSRHAARAMVA